MWVSSGLLQGFIQGFFRVSFRVSFSVSLGFHLVLLQGFIQGFFRVSFTGSSEFQCGFHLGFRLGFHLRFLERRLGFLQDVIYLGFHVWFFNYVFFRDHLGFHVGVSCQELLSGFFQGFFGFHLGPRVFGVSFRIQTGENKAKEKEKKQ